MSQYIPKEIRVCSSLETLRLHDLSLIAVSTSITDVREMCCGDVHWSESEVSWWILL
jgi:hypothetical protein